MSRNTCVRLKHQAFKLLQKNTYTRRKRRTKHLPGLYFVLRNEDIKY